MDINNDSSSNPHLKPGPQTPGNNKRFRVEEENTPENQIRIIHQENLTSNNRNSRYPKPSIQQNDFPPITLEFKSTHNSTDRKLIEELIKEWKIKNNKQLDIIGRFGFKNVLLIFARNTETLDELLDKNRWPIRIDGNDYTIKYPRILPETYSLVIKDFQLTWKEKETAIDLHEKYSSLIKFTRLITRDGRPMNIVRADFNSSQQVNKLLNQGEIDINAMKLYVRPYFAPIKINKCRKCFKHDHFTNQCASPQLCFRCGQQHSYENGCTNDVKCANCEQQHYSGHPACPVVQQRRKQIAEQQKVHHAQLLVKQQQQHQKYYDHDPNAFPHLTVNPNSVPARPCLDSTISLGQTTNQRSYASVGATKPSGQNENIEQLIMSLSKSINRQLTNFTVTMTSQIASIAKRIDSHNDRLQNIENQIQESVIPAIYELSKVVDHILQHNDKVKIHQPDQTSSCTAIIQTFFQNKQPIINRNPQHNQHRQITNLTQTLTEQINNKE
jgi:hypothetical protein